MNADGTEREYEMKKGTRTITRLNEKKRTRALRRRGAWIETRTKRRATKWYNIVQWRERKKMRS